ncbi:hypothetical protein PAXINDRAFT_102772 [Paxillus involutus ATCC 200175]|uniref:DUF6593 domain-containing protein n=1 Tax=Paxillus involutus ATCC 200175 TaxID=664439 RepID=A0A0C9TKH2_PAXIN|nr:hypothetical protein PAXINDRAFT_102772 [Paxillus involutus ATCC 200175]
MRLIYSDTDYLNTDISDEQGHKLYTISTPWAFTKITTITKYHWSGHDSVAETMGVIEWHWLGDTIIRFNGREVAAQIMLEKRSWENGRYCWLKPAGSDVKLARFHKQNLGIFKEFHPPYLDVSSTVVHIMDHIIVTHIYAEELRHQRNQPRQQSSTMPGTTVQTGMGPSC